MARRLDKASPGSPLVCCHPLWSVHVGWQPSDDSHLRERNRQASCERYWSLAFCGCVRNVADSPSLFVLQTAETLDAQTRQMEKVIDDLDEIHFTMKKARQVIRDITRGIATDK